MDNMELVFWIVLITGVITPLVIIVITDEPDMLRFSVYLITIGIPLSMMLLFSIHYMEEINTHVDFINKLLEDVII